MAYIDLSSYDVLDLLPVAKYPDSLKEEYLHKFTTAYMSYVYDCLGTNFDKHDSMTLETLMNDEMTNPEEIDEFIKSVVPNYEEFLMAVSLKFKKEFLISFYKDIIDSTKEMDNVSIPLYQKAISEAECDNWVVVERLMKEIEENDCRINVTKPPEQVLPVIPQTQIPAVVPAL